MNQSGVSIIRSPDSGFSHAILEGLDDIFFSSSGTQSFASPEARAAFRERWLGSYLIENSKECFVAIDSASRPAGYLVGALRDPANDPRLADLTYFQAFKDWTRFFPAHLHINVAAQHRSSGIGARLIEAFAAHACAQRVPGMHVVTGKGMRNVGFYERNGFELLAEAPWKSGTVVMLGRSLA